MSKKMTSLWGIEMTLSEEMELSLFRRNNPGLPAPNTLSMDDNRRFVTEWLEKHRAAIRKEVQNG